MEGRVIASDSSICSVVYIVIRYLNKVKQDLFRMFNNENHAEADMGFKF